MKSQSRVPFLASFATLALLAAQATAQTQYTVSILPVPAPYLGGNVASINNGAAVGWAYTNCTSKPGCVTLEAPVLWSGAGGTAVSAIDMT